VNGLKVAGCPPFRTPSSLEKVAGCKGRYAPGEEGEDVRTRSSPPTAPMGARRGESPALEG
jgi:hypothetical protein